MSYTYFNISDKLRLYEFDGLLDQYGDAAAAYSLRKLRNDYTGSAIRVRRSSDDAERDMGFYDNELDTVALLDWVNEDVTQYTSNFSVNTNGWAGQGGTSDGNIDGIDGQDDCLRLTVDTSTGNHRLSNSTLFDDRPNSFRIELDYYIPSSNIDANSIRILTSGNDTGFLDVLDTWTSATLDTGQVPSGYFYIAMYASGTNLFTGNGADVIYVKNIRVIQTSSNGLVQTWYDQSANANHAVQGTATAQPKIVDAGVVVTEGGKTAIQWDGVDDSMEATGFGSGQERSVFTTMIGNGDGSGYENYFIFSAGQAATGDFMQIYSTNYTLNLYGNFPTSSLDITSTTPPNTQQVISFIKTTANSYLYQNTSSTGTGSGNQNLQDYLNLGNFSYNYAVVKFQEFIVYNSDKLSIRTDVETNINTYYSIY